MAGFFWLKMILSQWNAIDLFEPDGERRLFEALGVRALPAVPSAKPAATGAGLTS